MYKSLEWDCRTGWLETSTHSQSLLLRNKHSENLHKLSNPDYQEELLLLLLGLLTPLLEHGEKNIPVRSSRRQLGKFRSSSFLGYYTLHLEDAINTPLDSVFH